jgi:hypothetical protein
MPGGQSAEVRQSLGGGSAGLLQITVRDALNRVPAQNHDELLVRPARSPARRRRPPLPTPGQRFPRRSRRRRHDRRAVPMPRCRSGGRGATAHPAPGPRRRPTAPRPSRWAPQGRGSAPAADGACARSSPSHSLPLVGDCSHIEGSWGPRSGASSAPGDRRGTSKHRGGCTDWRCCRRPAVSAASGAGACGRRPSRPCRSAAATLPRWPPPGRAAARRGRRHRCSTCAGPGRAIARG